MGDLVSVLLDRLRWFRQAGITFGGKRDTYDILGYQRLLSYTDYRARYLRDGIAKRIVEAYPNATWRGGVELFEDEDPEKDTPFEQDWKDLETKFNIWQRLQQVDILAGLSTYAVLLIGAPGTSLSEELPKGKPGDLLYFTPFSGGGGPGGDGRSRSAAFDADCSIAEFDIDAKSPRFGDVLSYQLKRTDIAAPMLDRSVHWTRVIHVAEGCLTDNVYGVPTLENVWNLLDDLAKVTGGGAEAFWLRANAGIHLDVDKDLAVAAPKPGDKSELDNLKQQAEDYANQLTRMIRTRGVAVTQLGSDVANFGPSADAILKQIGGSKGIPTRILTGSEMGTLASEQDAANFDSQVQDRRTGYAGPCIVRRLVDRLIEYGYLTTPKQYEVGWPVEENLDETGKADLAAKLASVNQVYGATVFPDDFIRDKCFDLEALPETDPFENLTELDRASLAAKMALVNKEMGVTVFTDDEIRKRSFGFEPLSPDQKVPIGAPERISVGAPPKLGSDGQPVPQDGQALPVVPVAQPPRVMQAQLRELEAAIENDDAATILKIVGVHV